ncbi:DgyrCDS9864 [Dimorphilus gyrociliatus]|uniref:DgyrCDS9864 n=1 Tax=Dimorphilus gyrociliatus TaxID=2664684 RepID=A0A7I8VZX3_9ANNE|nr:DgyrCDS9864 [Dimorphilus gyrociliatus]
MWSIHSLPNKYTRSNVEGEKVCYHLFTNKEYKLGRSPNCDLSFPENKAMSREHATLTLKFNRNEINNSKIFPIIKFMDKSTSGTMFQPKNKTIKGGEIDIAEPTVFWIGKSSYKIVYEPFVICPSGLNFEEKRIVENDILTLGGHMVNEWSSDVTHCLSNKIILTKKVVCALASGKPIVQRSFITKLMQDFHLKNSESPDPREHLPKFVAVNLQEMGVKPVDCSENLKRNNLLRGWKFFLMSKNQKSLLANALKELDAKVVIVESENDAKLLCQEIEKPKTCVLGVDVSKIESTAVKNMYPLIRKKLNDLGKRFITDSDVAMAMIKCDPMGYCDPNLPAQSQLQTNSEQSQFNVFVNTKSSSTGSPPTRKRPSESFEETISKRSRISSDTASIKLENTFESTKSSISVFKDSDINTEKDATQSRRSSKRHFDENEENSTESDIVQSSIPWPSPIQRQESKVVSPPRKVKKVERIIDTKSEKRTEIVQNDDIGKFKMLESTNKWLSKKRVPNNCKYVPENDDLQNVDGDLFTVKSASLVRDIEKRRKKVVKGKNYVLPEVIGLSDMVKHTVKTIEDLSTVGTSKQQYLDNDSASQKVSELFN